MNAATVGTSVEPRITACAPLPATWSAAGLYEAFSAGKIFEYTVFTPSAFSLVSASCTGGAANGASALGEGAGFGRWPGGSEATQLTNGISSSSIGRLTSNMLCADWLAGLANTEGAPPAPSIIAERDRAGAEWKRGVE